MGHCVPAKTGQSRAGRVEGAGQSCPPGQPERRENEAGKPSKQALRVGRVGSSSRPRRQEMELGTMRLAIGVQAVSRGAPIFY